jgi:3-methyl-2-oxobutanoate hydroxymethyltransferase
MSATPHTPVPTGLHEPLPMTLPRMAEKKRLGEPIVMVTAYDYPSAQVAQEAGVDVVLVGDSGAMTVLGYPSTVPVSTDEMLMLASAVRRGLRTPLLVGDLPFGSYEGSDEQAIATAQRFIKEAGCDAVKLERGGTSVQRARAIVQAGIPVMGHVGLTPQTATALGGYRATDGQVLVFHDLLGIYDGHVARFAKRYADVRAHMVAGLAEYTSEVRSGAFPAPEHWYSIDDDELASFRAGLK